MTILALLLLALSPFVMPDSDYPLILCPFCFAEAGECCDSYTDVLGDYHSVQWCDNYCCGSKVIGLTCCDSSYLQAPDDDRLGYCELWWGHHVWAPVLVGIGSLAILICCCVCCYRCCCRSTHHTTIIQSSPYAAQPGGVSVTSVNSTSVTNTGYNQPVMLDKINPSPI